MNISLQNGSDAQKSCFVDDVDALKDTSAASRWKYTRRIVLNDRLLLLPNESLSSGRFVILPDAKFVRDVWALISDYKVAQASTLLVTQVQKVMDLIETRNPVEIMVTEVLDAMSCLKALDPNILSSLPSKELQVFWMNIYHATMGMGHVCVGEKFERNFG